MTVTPMMGFYAILAIAGIVAGLMQANPALCIAGSASALVVVLLVVAERMNYRR